MMDKQNQFDAQEQPSQTASSEPVNLLKDKELSPALPKGWHTPREKGLKGSVYLSALVEQRSHLLVRLVGYGLLVFSLLDYIHLVIPPRFTDPLWEFQTIGALVEHVAAPLLGLMFVFYRHEGYLGKGERNLLGFLSWVSLLVGLLYLLMLPLGVADTWRIYQRNNAQIAAQVSQQTQQFQKIKGQLNQAKTAQQIKQLLASLTPEGPSPEIHSLRAFKEQFLARISQSERSIQVQADSVRTNQRQALIKNSVKWNLGALISGILFILIWHLTSWARGRQY